MGHPRPVRIAVVLLLSVVMLVGAVPVGAVTPGLGQAEDGLRVALDSMRQLATDTRNNKKQKKTTRPKKGLPVKLGKDGRLTVLLAGSDWRKESGGERLDVVMVATIDPTNGNAAVVSIPRDMAGIPLAGGGNSGGMRVNSIYFLRYRDPSLPHAAVDRKAMKKFSADVAAFLGTEIDYWALTRFATFSSLVNSLGGLRVDIREEVRDSSYHHKRSRGVYFPVKQNYKLKGDPACKPYPAKCHSALVYARSRKGTMGNEYNSDWKRAERQQEMVRAAVKGIIDEGAGIELVGRLLKVRDQIDTNIPKTVEAAGQLYALVQDMKLRRTHMKVLAPATWGYLAGDGTVRPNLARIRTFVDEQFYPVKKKAAKKQRKAKSKQAD
jgi:anionic cell wall polymer biosynthesis LytR-Cps2A-Psr (LCP) family protein